MRYISLFSGIEAASCAWGALGWEPVAFSEIEPFPKTVLANRYPNVPDLGDMTRVDWNEYRHTADVVVGGSPCQAFSVAGLRKALDDPRGQLMLEYLRACHAIDPEWIVWENVPGALSAQGGRAFQTLLRAVAELWPDGGAAWRVLDAQFSGVAQRRRRVFLVINTRDWRRAGPVLFERESVQWDSASSREKRQALARGIETGTRTTGFNYNAGANARSLSISEELSPMLKTEPNQAIYQIAGNIIGRDDMNGGHQLGVTDPDENGAFTLTSTDRHAVYCATDSGSNAAVERDLAPTLTAHDAKSTSYVSVPSTLQMRSGKAGGGKGALVAEDMSATLTCGVQQTLFPGNGTVRRLTPMECERLQGFEDGYTDIPYRGKPHAPDSARYKALGNSMAVPVMRWIGEGISLVDKEMSR